MGDEYGPLVRLWGVDPSAQLPSPSAAAEELQRFLGSVLAEALPLYRERAGPGSGDASSRWRSKGVKTSAHSASPVHLLERTVPEAALARVASGHGLPASVVAAAARAQGETWAARRSVHEDAAAAGTASWAEWVRCFKDEHAVAEKAFTPSVIATRVLREWDCGGVAVDAGGAAWAAWTLRVEESVHRLPSPLRPRVFPLVQATATARGRHDFVVVQMAARGDDGQGQGGDGGDGTVRGAYTSVERLREAPGGIEWTMATVSDAGGVVPAWVQRLAVPAQIAKDVDLFLGWIVGERERRADRQGEAEGGRGP